MQLGQFLKNRICGFGFGINASIDSEYNYIGLWEDNVKQGIGIEIWPQGSFYKGEFINNKRQGLGSFFWSNGASYQGYWNENKINGFVS